MQQYFRNYLVLSFITYLRGRELQEVRKPPEILYKMVQAFMSLCVFTRFSKGISDSPPQKHVQKWIHLPMVSRLISSIAEDITHVFWFSIQWARRVFFIINFVFPCYLTGPSQTDTALYFSSGKRCQNSMKYFEKQDLLFYQN